MNTFFTLALAGAASAMPLNTIEHKFMIYLTEFGKSYSSLDEFNLRLGNFMRNHKTIEEHNADVTQTFQLGHNHMSDWTQEEYKSILTYVPHERDETTVYAEVDSNEVPNSVDWIANGAVNAIKDQGQCGSCWAFSTVGSMEGAWKIKSGTLYNFAE